MIRPTTFVRAAVFLAAGIMTGTATGQSALAKGGDMGEPFGQPNWQLRQEQRDNRATRRPTDDEIQLPVVTEYIPPAYQPDRLVALNDPDLDAPALSDGLSASIRYHLTSGAAPTLRVHASERQPILDHFVSRDFAPMWISEAGLTERARRLLSSLSQADAEGLDAASYLPGSLHDFADDAPASGAAVDLARLEIELTVAALKYARHASAGRIVPSRLGKYVDLHPEVVAPATALARLTRTVQPGTYLEGLHPTHDIYLALRRELSALHAKANNLDDDIVIPGGDLLKSGDADPRVPAIQRKLEALGLLDAPTTPATGERRLSEVYSDRLVAAVKEFQERHGLTSDGVVGPATTRAMNGDSTRHRIQLVTLNMERARWLPEELGARHVIVNQPAFELRLFDDGEVTHRARVIIGKRRHQTAMFSDRMEYVELNPYWNVPRSIATNEMLPQLMADPSYLDARGFEVFGPEGRVSSSSVDWTSYDASTMPYSFRQPPGSSNALGYMKFMFPNRHAIYLHDTPSRGLFNRERRMFSHGCVRVHKADIFADIILGAEGWSRDRIQAAVRTGANRRVNLSKPIGVHLTYFTAWADESGLSIYEDVYGRDAQLRAALGDNHLALK